jgi:NAD-dependent deacetylase
MLPLGFEPNITHKVLAKWEAEGKLSAVVTQNIDGLHQKAGSKAVYELHGSVLRNYCTRCGKFHTAEFIKESDGIPRCSCGGIVKPDVVLYEEGLDQKTIESSVMAIHDADMLIVAGTSLTVYPAAGLIRYYQGKKLVLINRDETPYDSYADLVIHDSLGNVFSKL